jgi:hypothetical protein
MITDLHSPEEGCVEDMDCLVLISGLDGKARSRSPAFLVLKIFASLIILSFSNTTELRTLKWPSVAQELL